MLTVAYLLIIFCLLHIEIIGRSPSGRAIRYNGLPSEANHFHCYP
jgi:hypothetical protein